MRTKLHFITLLFLATLFSLPGYSALYLVGDATTVGWDAGNAIEMTETESGVYTWTGPLYRRNNDGYLKFLTVKGNWNNVYSSQTDGEELSAGEHNLTHYDGSTNNNLRVIGDGTYTLEVNTNTLSLKVSSSFSFYESLFVVGEQFGNWNIGNASEFTNMGNGVFSWNGKLENNKEFKFITNNNNWDDRNYFHYDHAESGDALYINIGINDNKVEPLHRIVSTEGYQGSKFKVSQEGKYNLVVDTKINKLYAYHLDSLLYLVGSATGAGWDITKAVPMINRGGVFTWTGYLKAESDNVAGQLKFVSDNVNWGGTYSHYVSALCDTGCGGSGDKTYSISNCLDTEADLNVYKNGNTSVDDVKFSISKQEEGYYSLELDTRSKKLKVQKMPSLLYAVGTAIHPDEHDPWLIHDAVPMLYEGGGIFVYAGYLKAGEIKFITDKDQEWVGGIFDHYVSAVEGKTLDDCISSPASLAVLHNSDNTPPDYKFLVPSDGFYKLRVNLTKKKLYVEKSDNGQVLYMVGPAVNGNWGLPASHTDMYNIMLYNSTQGKFIWTGILHDNWGANGQVGCLKFISKGDVWDDANMYYKDGATADVPITKENTNLSTGGQGYNFIAPHTCTYRLKVDIASNPKTLNTSTNFNKIIWTGEAYDGSNEWDNRNNWYSEDGLLVTCLDELGNDLQVVIPDRETTDDTPVLPEFSDVSRPFNKMQTLDGDKFASNITIENGGALIGVENLKDGNNRYYDEAYSEIVAGRSEWILVGTVVRPFENGESGNARDVVSGDFYLNGLPHVYMHKADVSGNSISWNDPFPDMSVSVPATSAFAVRVPDQYGSNKLKAESYYRFRDPSKTGDGVVPKTFSFKGLFYNESSLPVYSELVSGESVLLNNTYPANILVGEIESQGAFQIYDYSLPGFKPAVSTDEIKPQQGFLFTPGVSITSLSVPASAFTPNSTKYKSATAEYDYGYVELKNVDGNSSGMILVKVDPLKDNDYVIGPDAPMAFNDMEDYSHVPQIYITMYGENLSGVSVPDTDTEIPLGVVLKQNMNIKFSCPKFNGLESLVLIDRETGAEYNLAEGESLTLSLKEGTYEGRFYLNIKEFSENVVTDVTGDTTDANEGISILSDGKALVISSTGNVSLEKAYITDMSGRTSEYRLSNKHYNKINSKMTAGVYLIKVVADNCSRTDKIIVR